MPLMEATLAADRISNQVRPMIDEVHEAVQMNGQGTAQSTSSDRAGSGGRPLGHR